MNKNEFLEMKNEFAEYIYRYEYFLKCGAINDCYYNHVFGKNLDEVRKYDLENKLIMGAIKLKSENKPQEEIDKFIADFKQKFADENAKIEEKHRAADIIFANNEKLTPEERKQFEEDYLAYVKANHPIVKCFASEEEEKLFYLLNQLYKENNILGFKEVIEMNKNIFKEVEYKEEDFNQISAYFYDTKKNINADYLQKQNAYPYNKQDVLKNEISIAREMGEIKVRTNQLIASNKELHKDYIENFGEDISIN